MERGFSPGVCLGVGGPGREGGAGCGTDPGRAEPVVTWPHLCARKKRGRRWGPLNPGGTGSFDPLVRPDPVRTSLPAPIAHWPAPGSVSPAPATARGLALRVPAAHQLLPPGYGACGQRSDRQMAGQDPWCGCWCPWKGRALMSVSVLLLPGGPGVAGEEGGGGLRAWVWHFGNP